jgi:dolichol kinase
MSTETVEERAGHRRSLTVVSLTTLSGIAAALLSATLASAATDTIGLYPLAGAIVIQLPVLRLLGIDVEDFGIKDNLYVAFMTFALWFVTWTILLTTGATL